MNCKFLYHILFITLICNKSYSQVLVKIGLTDEIIYSFELNNQHLYFDFFKSKNNFSEIKILGMGEATHVTKKFFSIKKETFKFLTLNYHYRIFGIETSAGGCNYINDYVSSGIGDIDSVNYMMQ